VTKDKGTLPFRTCLGCGCTCDDIALEVAGGRITKAGNACDLGRAWFGDGVVPTKVLIGGKTATLEEAVDRAAALLAAAKNPMVYLAGDLTIEAARHGLSIADRVRARLDSPASDTVVAGLVAQQTRGRAAATLGELFNRADVVVFWAVDPAERYPRFRERYSADRKGLAAPEGRASRTLIAVDVGPSKGPKDADHRVSLTPEQEIAVLGAIRAAVAGRQQPEGRSLADLVDRLKKAKYTSLVYDAEPSGLTRSQVRVEALVALTQALNGPSRAALTALRAGNNRSGIEALSTWQTGFPFAVDFSRGFPRYLPEESASQLLQSGGIDLVLLAGSPATVPEAVRVGLGSVQVIAVGPRASEVSPGFHIAVDTGVAGIHEEGTAYRMDDVPIPLRLAFSGPPAARGVLQTLNLRVLANGGSR
jgi:formylmethanofuran dehydrogenase subunit B